jgi:filamentous hemagglutinin family protein
MMLRLCWCQRMSYTMPWLLVLNLLGSAWLPNSYAQISLDGSLGPRGSLSGPHHVIPADVGQTRGPNLFHSFGTFNLRTGESATFTGPSTVGNILSRVTGGTPSHIDGLLRTTIPGANFYLLNPQGVSFGPNASLDVTGSFHVSTADYLRLADGAIFATDLGRDSVLSAAPPTAFGFLRLRPAPISVQGSSLRVGEGQTFSVLGGDLTITGSATTSEMRPSLGALSGRVYLASLASPGEVRPSASDQPPGLHMDNVASLGTMDMRQGARVDTSGAGSGTVVIRSGRLLMDSARVVSHTRGDTDGARVGLDIEVDTLTLTGGSDLETDVFGAGAGGMIQVTATDTVTIDGTTATGLNPTSTISSVTASAGAGGGIVLSAPELRLVDRAFITSGVDSDTFDITGRGGDIVLQVGRLILTGASQINALTTAVGDGGKLTVTATESITMTGRNTIVQVGMLSGSVGGPGNAGDIVVTAPRVTLAQGAVINTSTTTAGRAGDIRVTATEALTLTGTSPDKRAASGIRSETRGQGNAGTVVVQAPTVTVDGGAIISTSTGLRPTPRNPSSSGQGGRVTIRADTVILSGPGSEVSSATGGRGAGGDVLIQARNVQLADGARILADSTGTGDAGNLHLGATETFRSRNSTVTTQATQASGGDITLRGGRLVQMTDSVMTAEVAGGPQTVGGNITVDAALVVLERSAISANAVAGQGGNVRLTSQALFADPATTVSASSTLGIDGTVDLQASVANLSETVQPLPQAIIQAEALLRQRCAAQGQAGRSSSFVVRGRSGVPAAPEGGLPGPLFDVPSVAQAEHLAPSQRSSKTLDAPQVTVATDGQPHLQGWPSVADILSSWRLDCPPGAQEELQPSQPTKSGRARRARRS